MIAMSRILGVAALWFIAFAKTHRCVCTERRGDPSQARIVRYFDAAIAASTVAMSIDTAGACAPWTSRKTGRVSTFS